MESTTEQDPRTALCGAGLKVTAQRLAVLRAVGDEPHATADRVAELAGETIGTISRQSVYDTLNLLDARGLLRRIQPAGSPARFECRVGDNHHHLVCRDCGVVVDVDCATGDVPCLDAGDHTGFIVDEAEVTFWGQCATCASRPRPDPPGGGNPPVARNTGPRGGRRPRAVPEPATTRNPDQPEWSDHD